MDFKEYREMYEKPEKWLHNKWIPRLGDIYLDPDLGLDIKEKINTKEELNRIKNNKDNYVFLTSGRERDHPELLKHGGIMNKIHLGKRIAEYYKSREGGTNDTYIENLKVAMYIFFDKKWDAEAQEWIDIN